VEYQEDYLSSVSVIATFLPKTGEESNVESVLRGMIAPTRAEPGCERYELYRVGDQPLAFVLFEMYTGQAALEAHRNTAHYKFYRARIADLLSEPIKVQLLQVLDTGSPKPQARA
jgi:quinol monooxygenase YgiN